LLFKSDDEKNRALLTDKTDFRSFGSEIPSTDKWYVDPQEWWNYAKGDNWFVSTE